MAGLMAARRRSAPERREAAKPPRAAGRGGTPHNQVALPRPATTAPSPECRRIQHAPPSGPPRTSQIGSVPCERRPVPSRRHRIPTPCSPSPSPSPSRTCPP
jgi:hypothetical protein